MITAIEDIYYYVSDRTRAVEFYTGILGFRVVFQDDVWTGLVLEVDTNPDPVKLGLLSIGAPVPQHSTEINGRPVHAGGTLSLRSDNIAADYDAMQARMVTIVRPLEQGEWGSAFLLADPDGNVLMVYQAPAH